MWFSKHYFDFITDHRITKVSILFLFLILRQIDPCRILSSDCTFIEFIPGFDKFCRNFSWWPQNQSVEAIIPLRSTVNDLIFFRTEMLCTLECTKDDECLAFHYNKTTEICEMGYLKYRIDLAKGSGLEVKAAKGHLPEKGRMWI